jgi:hypothetical protein
MAVILGVRRVTTPTPIPTTASRRSNYAMAPAADRREPNAEAPSKSAYTLNDNNTAANVNTSRVNTRSLLAKAGPTSFGRTPPAVPGEESSVDTLHSLGNVILPQLF